MRGIIFVLGFLWSGGFLMCADTRYEEPRIVCLGGAVTEIVYALGYGEHIVGVDQTSLYPPEATKLAQVGYVRQLSTEGILGLNPTLILAIGDAGPPDVMKQLESAGVDLLVLDAPLSYEGIQEKLTVIADKIGAEKKRAELTHELEETRKRLLQQVEDVQAKQQSRILFLMHHGGGQWAGAGTGTAADALIALVGGENVLNGLHGYKTLSTEAMAGVDVDYVFVGERSLGSMGGFDRANLPIWWPKSSSGENAELLVVNELEALGFGLRTLSAALQIAEQLQLSGKLSQK